MRQPADADDQFELILALAQHANTEIAREILGEMRDAIDGGEDAAPWIAAVQLAGALGALEPEVVHFLLGMITESAIGVMIDDDPLLTRLSEGMRSIARDDGLTEDEDYFVNDAPVEWQEYNRQWEARFDALHVALLRQHGEPALAMMLLLRPGEFHDTAHRGWARSMDLLEDDEDEDYELL